MAITNLYALRARLMAYGTSFHFRNWERLYASRGLRQSEISIQHLEKDEAETWTWHVSSPFRHWHYSCPVPPLYSPWMKARVDFLHLFSARLISNHLTLCTHSLPKRPHWTIRPREETLFWRGLSQGKGSEVPCLSISIQMIPHVYPILRWPEWVSHGITEIGSKVSTIGQVLDRAAIRVILDARASQKNQKRERHLWHLVTAVHCALREPLKIWNNWWKERSQNFYSTSFNIFKACFEIPQQEPSQAPTAERAEELCFEVRGSLVGMPR